MDLESLKAIFDGFDLAAFLPEIDSILGWVETILRLCVMIGPLLLLGFGLMYLLVPPKEANYSLGYRFFWSMSSLDVWRFTHRLVGVLWTVLGLVLSILMAVVCNAFRRMETMQMLWSAVRAIGWELGLTVAVCLLADVIIILTFDSKGYRRGKLED